MSEGYGSIGELCIALAHRWEPQRLFMIFTAYFDEADTHGPSPTVIVAGYVGYASQWRKFETDLRRVQRRFGFSIFHAKDFKARQGEFKDWSDEKCFALIEALVALVRDDLTEGVTIFLERERYEREYRAPPIPKKMNLDSQLGVCFRGCLGRLLQLMEERKNRDVLHVVMEDGHPNVWDCGRIFKQLKDNMRPLGNQVLGDFTVKSKLDCPPLMVADMLAATHSITRTQVAAGQMNMADWSPLPAQDRRSGRLAFLELDAGALRGLKDGFEELRRLKAEQWRQARDARRAASEERS